MPPIKLHELRHGSASLTLLATGGDMKSAQVVLRHSNASMTHRCTRTCTRSSNERQWRPWRRSCLGERASSSCASTPPRTAGGCAGWRAPSATVGVVRLEGDDHDHVDEDVAENGGDRCDEQGNRHGTPPRGFVPDA